MKFATIAATLFASSAVAYEILTPATANITYNKGQEVVVKYSAVDTDQEYITFALSNLQEPNRPVTFILGEDAHRDAGSVTLRIPCTGLDYTEGWKFWAINETNVYQILAESKNTFNINIHQNCVDPPALPSPTPAPYPHTPTYGNSTGPATSTITHTFCSTSKRVDYPTGIIVGPQYPTGGAKPEGPGYPGKPGNPPACAPTVTITVTAGGNGNGYPVKTPTTDKPTGTKGGYGGPHSTGGPIKPTPPLYNPTNAASSLQMSGFAGLVVAAIAFML